MSRALLAVTIHGQPRGKQRARRSRHGGVFTPHETVEWESGAALMMRTAWPTKRPHPRPVTVEVWAIGRRPKRLCRRSDPDGLMWRPVTPDGDNVLKAACDALKRAGVVTDDARFVAKLVLSLYAEKNGHPRVEVIVREAVGAGPWGWRRGGAAS